MMTRISSTTTTTTDPLANALTNLADAGVTFVEVDHCPDATCECHTSGFSAAA